ncbi:SseB family protein [Paragemmobacter straminiformis]|uniref:SseB family protein n=1 Tax=Paragemmobacter straminiformis TaxID=2045119 RepID=A0A842I745_9RHOB|nr:SseB family protein [Gemmobacter straminiformis]
MTPLDAALADMLAHPSDDAARLRFYRTLADAELFLLLQAEASEDTVIPRVFGLEDGPVLLAFDLEERLAAFAEGPAPYAALPGRIIAAQLAGQETGLGLNLGSDPSLILPAEAMDWLAATLSGGPTETTATPVAFAAPKAPERLIAALSEKLARAGGLARSAHLAAVDYSDGRRSHMLAFLDASPAAHDALARAASEALTFSGLDAGEMDVTFLAATDPAATALLRAALRFDLPEPLRTEPIAPAAPGMDPDRPPRLR